MPDVKESARSTGSKIVFWGPLALALLILAALYVQTRPNDWQIPFTDREAALKTSWLFDHRAPCEFEATEALPAYTSIPDHAVQVKNGQENDDCAKNKVVGKTTLRSFNVGDAIDPENHLTPASLDPNTDYTIISIAATDPGGLASPGAKVNLLFVETRDVRTLPATPTIEPTIEGVTVLDITQSEDKKSLQFLLAIPNSEAIQQTLSRFANQIPAQVVIAKPAT